MDFDDEYFDEDIPAVIRAVIAARKRVTRDLVRDGPSSAAFELAALLEHLEALCNLPDQPRSHLRAARRTLRER